MGLSCYILSPYVLRESRHHGIDVNIRTLGNKNIKAELVLPINSTAYSRSSKQPLYLSIYIILHFLSFPPDPTLGD